MAFIVKWKKKKKDWFVIFFSEETHMNKICLTSIEDGSWGSITKFQFTAQWSVAAE